MLIIALFIVAKNWKQSSIHRQEDRKMNRGIFVQWEDIQQ